MKIQVLHAFAGGSQQRRGILARKPTHRGHSGRHDPASWHGETDGLGVDVAFEIGGTDAAVDLAMRAARPGARVVLVGIPGDDRTTFKAGLARRKGLTLVMSRRMKDVYPRTISLVERGIVDLGPIVTGRFPLDQAPAAFEEALSRRGLKTVISGPA